MHSTRYALAMAASVLLTGAAYAADQTPSTSSTTTDQAAPAQSMPPPADTSQPPADTSTSMPPAATNTTSTPAASTAAADVSANTGTQVVASAPVPDTPENRAKYGGPMSRAGKRTAAKGN